jgi:UPF0271 protein
MDRLLINCDLGENESDAQTERLLGLVDAANICCGIHAGSAWKTRKTLEIAAEKGVLIGAHPGLDLAGGRGGDLPEAGEFGTILTDQIHQFLLDADRFEIWVSYVKLHGSLYHAVEWDDALAEAYIDVLRSVGSGFGVFALAGGRFQTLAKAAGVKVWEEGFADRGYQADGRLVPRSEKGAVLGAEDALKRFEQWRDTGKMAAQNGIEIELKADTFCVHSDSPGSESLLQGLRKSIES